MDDSPNESKKKVSDAESLTAHLTYTIKHDDLLEDVLSETRTVTFGLADEMLAVKQSSCASTLFQLSLFSVFFVSFFPLKIQLPVANGLCESLCSCNFCS